MARRMLELDLLHHYATVVAATLPTSQEFPSSDTREIYVHDTGQMAFEYPFLLNTVFAIAALHLWQTETLPRTVPQSLAARAPPQTDATVNNTLTTSYANAHRVYLSIAIHQQRTALQSLSSSNADAVCLASVLLSIISHKILPATPNAPYRAPTQWLSMSRAIYTGIRICQPLLPANARMHRLMPHQDPDFEDKAAIFNPEHMIPFQALLDFSDSTSTHESTEEAATYRLAVAYIGSIHHAILSHDPQRQVARRIMATGPMLPALFVELIGKRRPRALAVLAHLMAMTKYVEGYWFFRDMAEHEVNGIQSVLPEEWLWALRFPFEMLATLNDARDQIDEVAVAVSEVHKAG